jgi:sugar-specific transcriptional regulator TrmB
MSDIADSNNQSLSDQLQAFGLNPIEAAIYLHLVNKPAKTMLAIARELNIPRTSVYDNALKLVEKGLLHKIVTFKSQKLEASPVNLLEELVEKEKVRVEELQTKLALLKTQLSHSRTAPTNTEVRYYYGAKGFQQMMWNALRAKDGIIGYSQFGRVEIVGERFVEKMQKEIAKRGIIDRVITNPSPQMLQFITLGPQKKLRVYQQTRIMDAHRLYISGDTSIYNDTFAIAYWNNDEVVGIEIDNPEFVRTQRTIFEEMWKLASPFEP